MEAEIGLGHGRAQHPQFGPSAGYDFAQKGKGVMEGRHRHEWDLNAWEWDGNLFIGRPVGDGKAPECTGNNQIFSGGCKPGGSPSCCSEDMNNNNNNDNGSYDGIEDALEKRRKVVVVEEEEECREAAACLTLKLGGNAYSIAEADAANEGAKNGKRPRVQPCAPHHPICQVDDCREDLNNAKDYHRRHKVCEMHAKATKALVGRLMQRFCQQCSRFHLLQEFDEGKRSCRRRLAGHNRRRRKSHPDGPTCLNDEHTSGSLIISLLRILSQLQTSNNSDQASDKDLLFQLLKRLVNSVGALDGTNMAAKQSGANQQNTETSFGASSEGVAHPLQNGFLIRGGPLEIGKPHYSHRQQISKCSIPNSSNTGSSSRAGNLDLHSNGVERITECPASGSAQPLTYARVPHTVSVPQHSTCTDFKSAVPQHSNNAWQIQEGFQQQSELTGSMPWILQAPSTVERRNTVPNNFDLNSVDNAPQDFTPGSDRPSTLMLLGGLDARWGQGAPLCHSWAVPDIPQTSPPQGSDNSESGSDQSPTSSQGDGQIRTGRIVFKLFGKDPSEFPQVLRSQILDWLAHSPSDIESYIRPGCVILTIYLRLSECGWDELGRGLKIGLERLLKASDNDFWKTGWIFVQVGHRVAFIYDGHILLDTTSNLLNAPKVLSVTPIAITAGKKTDVVVKGLNLTTSATKIVCAFQGKQLVQEVSSEYIHEDASPYLDSSDQFKGCMQIQSQRFSWAPQGVIGRCFIEAEGDDLRGSFFPVIVAEQDVCAEIRTLERYIEMPSVCNQYGTTQKSTAQAEVKAEVIDFLDELGWLLQKSYLRRQSNLEVLPATAFSPARFKWLLEYATERDWCAVVRKLLNILFSSNAKTANCSSVTILNDVGILHRAVRRNCRAMVEFLLAYVPESEKTQTTLYQGHNKLSNSGKCVIKPDMLGPAGITPLHIAASMEGAGDVLDALTSDPGEVGAEAWSNVRDQMGMTPEDYALLGGRRAYIELVQKKVTKKISRHVSLDIPESVSQEQSGIKKVFSGSDSTLQQGSTEKDNLQWNKADVELCQKIGQSAGLQYDCSKIKPAPSYCRLCDERLLRRQRANKLLYRPAMLSMVAIATVCVCVALLLKGPPQVLFIMPPFRWEVLKFGYI